MSVTRVWDADNNKWQVVVGILVPGGGGEGGAIAVVDPTEPVVKTVVPGALSVADVKR